MKFFNVVCLAKITIGLTFLVIIAGSVVRMSGSGMGCPDWPKCFGYYIPPTNVEQLTWRPNKLFEKGNVIIHNDRLYIARKNFTTKQIYFPSNWDLYTKHDYAKFNVYHTYTEYINRLFGALLGFFNLLMLIASFSLWKKKRKVVFLTIFSILFLGFQAWLGAKVVDSNLLPIKITIHMVVALLILALYIYIFKLCQNKEKTPLPSKVFNSLILAIVCVLIQVILGIQVRETIDDSVIKYGYNNKEFWLNTGISFLVHRSFSILMLLIFVWLYIKNKIIKSKWVNLAFYIVILEIITGIVMSYFHFPFASQPIHLLLASILFGTLLYKLLISIKKK